MLVLYTTKTCPYSQLAREFLRNNQISFQEIDVGEDKQNAEEMVRLSGQMGVPVLKAGEHLIVGWNKAAYEEQLVGVEVE